MTVHAEELRTIACIVSFFEFFLVEISSTVQSYSHLCNISCNIFCNFIVIP